MTPTQLITTVHAVKVCKDPEYEYDLKDFEQVQALRNLIFNSTEVDEKIMIWMNEKPTVTFHEVIKFREKNGK